MERITVQMYLENSDNEEEIEITGADNDGDFCLTLGRSFTHCSTESLRKLAITILRVTDGDLL